MYGKFHIIVKSGSLVTKVAMELYNKRGRPEIFGMRTFCLHTGVLPRKAIGSASGAMAKEKEHKA